MPNNPFIGNVDESKLKPIFGFPGYFIDVENEKVYKKNQNPLKVLEAIRKRNIIRSTKEAKDTQKQSVQYHRKIHFQLKICLCHMEKAKSHGNIV